MEEQGQNREELRRKKQDLEELVGDAVKKGVCIAFSGGVDSTLLLTVASRQQKRFGGTVYGVMFDTFLHAKGEESEARRLALECGADFAVIHVNELDNPAILDNPKNRCYHCKHFLFSNLQTFAKDHGCSLVMDGTNFDDTKAYRPGLKALEELGVLSPLKILGITKAQVRALAAEYGISVASKPSNSCLATRLPYGTKLETPVLEKIAAGETYLKSMGFRSVRIRFYDPIARIEVEKSQIPVFVNMREDIVNRLKELGFVYVTLDLEGFRSGSMDLVD